MDEDQARQVYETIEAFTRDIPLQILGEDQAQPVIGEDQARQIIDGYLETIEAFTRDILSTITPVDLERDEEWDPASTGKPRPNVARKYMVATLLEFARKTLFFLTAYRKSKTDGFDAQASVCLLFLGDAFGSASIYRFALG